jgi:uncharacterized phiE125 gp8 family phage protein
MYPFDVSDFVGFGPRLRFRDITRGYPRVTTPPVVPTQWLDDCKLHARISGSDEDGLVRDYMLAAIEAVENDAETALLAQTRTLYMDFFPAWEIELHCPPVTAVNSISYLDYAGVSQTYSTTLYRADMTNRPGIITPVYGTVWPVAYPVINAVQVAFQCGYAEIKDVPYSAKLAVYLKVANFYWNREMGDADETRYWQLIDKIRWRKF